MEVWLTDLSPWDNTPAYNHEDYTRCGVYAETAEAGEKIVIPCRPYALAAGRYMIITIPGTNESLTFCEVEAYIGKGKRGKHTKTCIQYFVSKRDPSNFSSLLIH